MAASNVKTPRTNEFLSWLVRSRAENQRLLLDLLVFGRQHPEQAGPHTLFQRIVGAAFSLWRAVFLVEGERQAEDIYTDAIMFLDLLVGDNMINYTQDRTTKRWTSGFYLNNAYYRLQDAYRRLPDSFNHRNAVDAFLAVQQESPFVEFDLQEAWTTAHEAAREIFASIAG